MTMAHKPLFVNQAINAIITNDLDESNYFYYAIKANISRLKTLDSGTTSGRENMYQKEWRFLGHANEKPKAPKIKTIYLGKNVSAENEKKIREYANLNNIIIKKLVKEKKHETRL